MATPYDNHDPGYSREERRIAADYGVDLDAPDQKKCFSCNKLTAERNDTGDCPVCVDLMRSEEALAFLTAPTLAGCLSLMGGE